MALTIVHRLCDRLLLQTEIDADFSDIMFSFIDERDQDARKRMLEEYWGLTDHADPPHSPSCHEEEEELQDDKGSYIDIYMTAEQSETVLRYKVK